MDIPATLVMIIVGAALVAWMTNPRTGQALDAWASGFIGYRSAGWPHGVQEDEPVHFTFSEPRDPDAPDPGRLMQKPRSSSSTTRPMTLDENGAGSGGSRRRDRRDTRRSALGSIGSYGHW